MRHVKQVLIMGAIIGVLLSACVYLYLTAVGNMVERENKELNYQTLRLSPALDWGDDECGLSPKSACVSLEYVYYANLVY